MASNSRKSNSYSTVHHDVKVKQGGNGCLVELLIGAAIIFFLVSVLPALAH